MPSTGYWGCPHDETNRNGAVLTSTIGDLDKKARVGSAEFIETVPDCDISGVEYCRTFADARHPALVVGHL
jgi:hypothetical protein